MNWERAYTINDFYDCPRFGVADLGGVPHIYSCRFNEGADEYDDVYLLSPITQELSALVIEDWSIWLRWEAHGRFKLGAAYHRHRPALAYPQPE
ncbi:MAG: hypothetical protein IPK82_34240 [Polyangiaceae bacterium]|nr:hypothetical protein [Polyangiaceae bacterium]